MQVVAYKLGPADKLDRFRCVRDDGSHSECVMPRQGILPHDLIHYVVESRLTFDAAFLGMVASGAELAYAMQQSHETVDPSRYAQAGQAESMVEALQTQLWEGAFDQAAFHEGLRGACDMRGVPLPDLSTLDIEHDLFRRAIELHGEWSALPFHSSMTLRFD
ncbi:MAG TPA: hypothetical protein VIT66_01580 [Lysobacter sp.]